MEDNKEEMLEAYADIPKIGRHGRSKSIYMSVKMEMWSVSISLV